MQIQDLPFKTLLLTRAADSGCGRDGESAGSSIVDHHHMRVLRTLVMEAFTAHGSLGRGCYSKVTKLLARLDLGR